jgi:membrane protein implicated in regulation of membrane protease activity
LETLLLILAIVFIAYEFFEHVVIPFLWPWIAGKGNHLYGPDRILGETGTVKEWQGKAGHIFIDGELWKASSEDPLAIGDKVVIQNRDGLMLTVVLKDRPSGLLANGSS